MSLETRLRNTGQQGGAGGSSSSSDSAGLAGTGDYYLTTSASATLNNSLVIQPGSSVTHHISGSNYYLNAITSLFAGSSGLAGKDAVYVLSSYNAQYTNAVYIRPGSSVTTHITGSNMFINAVTSTFAGSSGLAGKDAVYILSSYDAQYTNALYIKPGSSVTTHITGSNLFINAVTSAGASSDGLATKDAFYYVRSGNANLSNAITITSMSQAAFMLLAQQAKLYSNTSSARIDAGTPLWRLLYSNITNQYGVWQFVLPLDYGTNPRIRLLWGVDSGMAVARSCHWTINQWGWNPFIANSSVYVDTFGGSNTVSVALSAAYSSGTLQSMTIPLTTIVSMNAGNIIMIRIGASGGYAGNAEMYVANFEYAKT